MPALFSRRYGVGAVAAAALFGGFMVFAVSGTGFAAFVDDRRTFNDPADDQDGLAPDITSVAVSSGSSGTIVFEVKIRNYNTIKPRISFVVLVDADKNSRTGVPLGADYILGAGYQEPDKYAETVGRWNGANFDYSRPSSYSASFVPSGPGGAMRLEINRKDLGETTGFNFTISGYWLISSPQVYASDGAPDHPATWSFTLPTAGGGADADRDGVVDTRDRCPRARALYDANKNGCTGPFRRMRPDLKFRALGYPSYVTMASARVEDLPSGTQVEVRCRSACSVQQRQAARSPVVVLTQLRGTRLERGAVVEIRAVKAGWIGYYARIEIRGSPLATQTTERCLPALGKRVATPCSRVERGS